MGQWSGDRRPLAERIRDYDWDGAIGPVCAEISVLIADDFETVSRSFWDHYLTLPATAHVRQIFGEKRMAEQVSVSTRYTRAKYTKPFDEEWLHMAEQHAENMHRARVPLSALLSAFSFAHSVTYRALREKLADDPERLCRMADVIQRLALLEADFMASQLGSRDSMLAKQERSRRSELFRAEIGETIEGTSELGARVRQQAKGAADSTRGMLGKTSEVAAAAEQSAVAMREAAHTAAGLIRAI
ncbi:MAG: chemotaxis protein, partial [Alphaproteobacteria bacterium HGW-Alphaproteobacteria-16]